MTTQTLKRAAIAAVLALSAPALAQSEAPSDQAAAERIDEGRYKYRDVTEIEFDGTDVNAALLRPGGEIVIERRRGNFAPMIELRRDFNPEMDRSTDLIR